MLGLFAFLNLRELVFHECDEELWDLICDAEGALSENIQDGKYSSSATSHILHYFAPLLASQMVFALELGDGGLSEMGGESSTRISIRKVADITYILLAQCSSAGMQRLAKLTRTFFRLCTGVFSSNSCVTMDEYLTTLLRKGFRELARLSLEEPSFVLEADQELLIPHDISDQLSTLLKKVCGLSAMKYTIERIIMASGWKPVIVYTRSASSPICLQDLRLLSVLAYCCDIMADSSLRKYSSQSSQTHFDSLATSTSGSLAGFEWNSQSISLLTDLDMEPLIPSLTPTPSIAHLVVFLRHQDGGIRPHKVYVVEPVPDFRLLFLSKPCSTALVPFVYDAVELLDQIQDKRESTRMNGNTQGSLCRETYAGLSDVLQRISGSSDLRKLPQKLAAKARGVLEDFERGTLDNLWSTAHSKTTKTLPIRRNATSLKVTQKLAAAKSTFQEVLLHFRQMQFSHDPVRWAGTVSALNRGRAIVQKGLADIVGFLAVKCQTTLAVASVFPTLPCLRFVVFVSTNMETKARQSLVFSEGSEEFAAKVIQDLELMQEIRCENIVSANENYERSYRAFDSVFLAKHARQLRWDRHTEYELYCWYDKGMKDEILKSHGLFILHSCLECLGSTSDRVDYCVVRQSLGSLSRCSLWS